MQATRPEQAPKRYARWLEELRDPSRLRPYASFAALADRLQKSNGRLSGTRQSSSRATGAGRRAPGWSCAAIPAHKTGERRRSTAGRGARLLAAGAAPVLWVDAEAPTRSSVSAWSSARRHAERRAAFRDLKYVTVRDAGHMLHHDQPEAVARLIEEFV